MPFDLNQAKDCAICRAEFFGWGNNPEPFDGETCCDDCNDRFVTPTRMCLGRGCNNEPVLHLLQTIAEIGKAIRRVSFESRNFKVVDNDQDGDVDRAKSAQEG